MGTRNKTVQYNRLNDDEIHKALHELRLPGMLQALADQEAMDNIEAISFKERLGMLLYEEMHSRAERRRERLLKQSGIRGRMSCVDDILVSKARNLNADLVTQLAQCQWITEDVPPSVVVTGAAGTGKTWLVEALGKSACEHGLSVAYYRFPVLLEKITDAYAKNETGALRRRINCKQLLIIDDFGMGCMSDVTRSALLSIIDERIGFSATIIAAQLSMKDWYQYIGEAYHADALLDRLKNHSYKIELKGPSLREKHKL